MKRHTTPHHHTPHHTLHQPPHQPTHHHHHTAVLLLVLPFLCGLVWNASGGHERPRWGLLCLAEETATAAFDASARTASTAPVVEPIVLSFTVPLDGCTIVATTTVVTSYSSSADCPGSAAPFCCESVCVAMSCGGGFCSPGGAYDSVWDSVKPMAGKYLFNYFQYQEVVGCACMLNYWFSSNDGICPDNYNYSWFKLKDKCRSEKWEVYLYGDKSILVCDDRAWGPDVQKTVVFTVAVLGSVAVRGLTG